MKARTRRFALVSVGLASLAVAAVLVINAFEDNLVFFFTPTEIQAREAPVDRLFRIGGLVETGSVERSQTTTEVRFRVTDTANAVEVTYQGILPDLFREGQGVVAQGRLRSDGVFEATQVFARHDETYMPVEAAEAIKRAQTDAATTSTVTY